MSTTIMVSVPLDCVATEYVGGQWVEAGESEPEAVITYSTVASPETGHIGWMWWAKGKMGDAQTCRGAKNDAVAALRGWNKEAPNGP